MLEAPVCVVADVTVDEQVSYFARLRAKSVFCFFLTQRWWSARAMFGCDDACIHIYFRVIRVSYTIAAQYLNAMGQLVALSSKKKMGAVLAF